MSFTCKTLDNVPIFCFTDSRRAVGNSKYTSFPIASVNWTKKLELCKEFHRFWDLDLSVVLGTNIVIQLCINPSACIQTISLRLSPILRTGLRNLRFTLCARRARTFMSTSWIALRSQAKNYTRLGFLYSSVMP